MSGKEKFGVALFVPSPCAPTDPEELIQWVFHFGVFSMTGY